jgi:hypothetical protein
MTDVAAPLSLSLLSLSEVEPVPHGRTARRLAWPHLPPDVRRSVEGWLGSPVTDARSQGAGFTPGFASRLTAADGARLFVKAASKQAQPHIAASYAEEARKLWLLPTTVPAPRLHHAREDDRWVVLGFEDVEGRAPGRPWAEDELLRCLDTLARVAALLGDVGSLPAGLDLVPLHVDMPTLLTGWDVVAATRPDWPHLAEARELSRSLPRLPDAGHFVHADARDDNFLLARDGRTLLCDWNWPGLGPRWLDAVDLLVAAHADGLDTGPVMAAHPLTAGADPDHVDAWVAALCGFMLEADTRPVPASSPHLGVHRRWWAAATWNWLASRRGW